MGQEKILYFIYYMSTNKMFYYMSTSNISDGILLESDIHLVQGKGWVIFVLVLIILKKGLPENIHLLLLLQ